MKITSKGLKVFLCAAVMAGCGNGLSLSGDGNGDGDARGDEDIELLDDFLVEADLPVDPDAPDLPDELEVFCETSYYWELDPRRINSVMFLDSTPPRLGVTNRLLVEVQLLSACDFLGQMNVTVISGGATDFVGLAAFAWVPQGMSCPPSAPIVTWVVSVEGRVQGNMRVVVTDENSPGGGLRLEYDREYCSGHPDCQCQYDTPPGMGEEWSNCTTDCSCASGLSCIGYHGVGGPLWSCVRLCNGFLDCETGEECLPPIPDGAPYICSWGDDLCDTDEDCPAGFACATGEHGSFCLDRREHPIILPCECDEQCPTGHHCVMAYRDYPVCEVTCLRDADCPNPPETTVFICGFPGVCVVLGP